jgi:Ca-activated chloride channel family protein
MHFARSEYLQLLWFIPVLGIFILWSHRRRRLRLERFVSSELAPQLAGEFSRGKAYLRSLLLLGFFLFGILALARPQWGVKVEEMRRQGVDIMLALDTSFSMNAEDVAPTRLEKAKSAIKSLLTKLRGDRIGLVSFAGSAIVHCPLTLDYGAVNLFLDIANTSIIPEPGTSIAAAIETATGAFIAQERKYKVLIILTDGEDLEGQVDAAVEEAKDGGVIIYTLGVGTPEGRPIPERDEKGNIIGYRKDSDGKVVVSRLDERSLSRIADNTGGRYFRATTSESELDELYEEVSGMEQKELESRLYQNFEDQYQYPLALAILCLAANIWISERRTSGEKKLHGMYLGIKRRGLTY